MKYQQKGLTLLESVIALGLSTLLISAIAINYKSDKRQAEQIIAQLQMAKSGVLQYNIDNPESTRLLADLVRPSEATQEKWKGPYGDTTTRITPDGQFDISKTFPDSSLELVAETINGVIYQAVLLKGTAELQLKSTILAKCGSDCQPLPGRDDIGLLVQQIGIVAQNSGNGFETPTIPGTHTPPTTVKPPWKPPTVNPPPTIPPVYPPTNPPPPPVNPPPPTNPPPPPNPCAVVSCTGGPPNPGPPIPPTPSKCPDGSIRPNNGICPPPPPPPPPVEPPGPIDDGGGGIGGAPSCRFITPFQNTTTYYAFGSSSGYLGEPTDICTRTEYGDICDTGWGQFFIPGHVEESCSPL